METYAPPEIDISQYNNYIEKGKILNPVVVLEDILKKNKKVSGTTREQSNERKDKLIKALKEESENVDDLTKIQSSSDCRPWSSCRSTHLKSLSSNSENQLGRKRKYWDPSREYEIEKIMGYHVDRKKHFWYLVKWKGWPEEYNTLEPIENMTGCNYLLMKFFEDSKPTPNELKKKEAEIERSLLKYDIYLKLKKNNYKREILMEFSDSCLNITKLFQNEALVSFERTIKKEYEYIIRCLISMYFHQDTKLIERAQNYNICLKLIRLRWKQLKSNSYSQALINRLENTLVTIENNIDLEHFPEDLEYVVDLKHSDDIVVPNDPLLGCECIGKCSRNTLCCGKMANSDFAYTHVTRRLRIAEQTPIYECNWRCKCPKTCPNRVVQHGRKIKLCIFKTESCGWGVKTLEKIRKGAFVCEYIGELITDSEAVVRDVEYYKRNLSYLFDLDFNPDQVSNLYCVDATKYGNVGRFFNHSCDPNLAVYPVWINCLDPNLPTLAFFARRDIKKFEELHFDYENLQNPQSVANDSEEDKKNPGLRMISRVRCQCKAANCREWVFGNK